MINGEAEETEAEESQEEANDRSDFAPECGALSEASTGGLFLSEFR